MIHCIEQKAADLCLLRCPRKQHVSFERLLMSSQRMTRIWSLRAQTQTLAVVLALQSLAAVAAPLRSQQTTTPSWSSLDQQWTADLHELWLRAESGVAFCFGSSERSVLKLLQASFPIPLPVGPAEDTFCSNATKVTARLCRAAEIEHYYKVPWLLPASFS